MGADILDNASEIESNERERLIAKARKSMKVLATGHCLFCNVELESGKRFCSPDCRDDWELEQEAMRRHGNRW